MSTIFMHEFQESKYAATAMKNGRKQVQDSQLRIISGFSSKMLDYQFVIELQLVELGKKEVQDSQVSFIMHNGTANTAIIKQEIQYKCFI